MSAFDGRRGLALSIAVLPAAIGGLWLLGSPRSAPPEPLAPELLQPIQEERMLRAALVPPESAVSRAASGVRKPRIAVASEPGGAATVRSVRVSGRVLRDGRPLEDYDLEFRATSAGLEPGSGDWDFTAEDGRYEVWLAPGEYLVANGDGAELARVVVPADRAERTLDLDSAP